MVQGRLGKVPRRQVPMPGEISAEGGAEVNSPIMPLQTTWRIGYFSVVFRVGIASRASRPPQSSVIF